MGEQRRDWEESSDCGNTYVVVIYLNKPFTHEVLESFGEIQIPQLNEIKP